MERQLRRALWAGLLGLGVAAGLARAGEPSAYMVPSLYTMPELEPPAPKPERKSWFTSLGRTTLRPVRAVADEPCLTSPGMVYVTEGIPPTSGLADVNPHPHPVIGWLHDHCLACWSHHNKFGCGSFVADWNFVFGSCRSFFGEPCMPGRPPSPVLDNYDLRARGCGCARP